MDDELMENAFGERNKWIFSLMDRARSYPTHLYETNCCVDQLRGRVVHLGDNAFPYYLPFLRALNAFSHALLLDPTHGLPAAL